MTMLNTIIIMGRLTRDPELRHTQNNTPVASFTLACNRDYEKNGEREADFFDIVAWRHTAEFASKYFVKGQLVAVEGRLQTRKWE
jgi:single-strand DNA-binding protein